MLSRRLSRLKAYKTETSEARIRLSSNELPYSIPDEIREKISRRIASLNPSRYPDPEARELKEVVAEFVGAKPENILLGNGSDELIYYLSAVVGEPSEGILITEPTFPMYGISADVFGREVVSTLLGPDFDIDLPACLETVSSFPVAMAYFSYPNNPTGNLYSREKILEIREKGIFTVLDEAYFHYSGETFLNEALLREDTAVLRSLSKIGMAGLRVGILIAHENIVRELEKVRLPFNISAPSQLMARIILAEGREFIEDSVRKVIAERDRVFKELDSMEGVRPFPSRANFILFETSPPPSEVHSALLRRGVLVRDMSYMPLLENCLRVSIGTPEENDIFLEALEGSLREFQ
jgi:histidinol-phosphate aminotransferase